METKAAGSSNDKLGPHSFLFKWSCVLTVCLCGMERQGLKLENDSIVVLGRSVTWEVSPWSIYSGTFAFVIDGVLATAPSW